MPASHVQYWLQNPKNWIKGHDLLRGKGRLPINSFTEKIRSVDHKKGNPRLHEFDDNEIATLSK